MGMYGYILGTLTGTVQNPKPRSDICCSSLYLLMVFIVAEVGDSQASGPCVAVYLIYIYFLGIVPPEFSLPFLRLLI